MPEADVELAGGLGVGRRAGVADERARHDRGAGARRVSGALAAVAIGDAFERVVAPPERSDSHDLGDAASDVVVRDRARLRAEPTIRERTLFGGGAANLDRVTR
ncbi:hypothetical protein [Candidatus Solirubrobacter pratensis]|uniref:hypothetical protein n=1 Tax=Candidatus Solirubrobacter pratensis TaxID=1298857 RepID=UPI0012DC1118|nr:hypothetical protein [Candidatus Solirubrobacter pratensis]